MPNLFTPKSFSIHSPLIPLRTSPTGPGTSLLVLGNGGRKYQKDAYDEMAGNDLVILDAPTGSGKSALVLYAVGADIIKSDYMRKQVIVVSERNHARGFSHLRFSHLRYGRKKYIYEVEQDCCQNGGSVQTIRDFLLNRRVDDYYKEKKILGGVTAVVTRDALVAAFRTMTPSKIKKAVRDTAFYFDEAHHARAAGSIDPNELGNLIGQILSNRHNTRVYLVTATFDLRSDGELPLAPHLLRLFKRVSISFLDFWNTTGIELIQQQYIPYSCGQDASATALKIVKENQGDHHLILVPQVNHHLFRQKAKQDTVYQLYNKMVRLFGKHAVLDFVSPERQKQHLARFTDDKREDHQFKVILTCQVGKEGSDWPPCNSIINLVFDRSVLVAVQKRGRAFRCYPGKKVVRIYDFVPSIERWDTERTREIFSDRFNTVAIASFLMNRIHPIPLAGPYNEEDYCDCMKKAITQLFLSETPEEADEALSCLGSDLAAARKTAIRTFNLDDPSLHTNQQLDELLDNLGWDKVYGTYVLGRTVFEGSYDRKDIRDAIAKCALDLSSHYKAKGLQLVKNGKPRPSASTPEGAAFCRYSNPNKPQYDEDWTNAVDSIDQYWLSRHTSDITKSEILKLARSGKPRPKDRLGNALVRYTNQGSSYDPDFDKLIRKLRSDWFESRYDKVARYKAEIIQLAKDGKSRPAAKTKLGGKLCRYTAKSSSSYDSDFDKLIRKLRSDWFKDSTKENKKLLIAMAKSKKKRPNIRIAIGNALSKYLSKKSPSYDQDFDKLIRRLCPDWFVTSETKKKLLFAMAKEEKPRPTKRSGSLGAALVNYTNKASTIYDPVFDKEIRKLRPDWFKNGKP